MGIPCLEAVHNVRYLPLKCFDFEGATVLLLFALTLDLGVNLEDEYPIVMPPAVD
jgi:hypothetical protein